MDIKLLTVHNKIVQTYEMVWFLAKVECHIKPITLTVDDIYIK